MPKKRPKEASTRWGGRRRDSGRKSRQKIARELQVSDSKAATAFRKLSLRERFPLMPLEYLLGIFNEIDPKTGKPCKYLIDFKIQAAARAAPFIHPKLSNINLQARQKYSVDVDKLNDDELVEFERLLVKCQVPVGQQTPEDVAAEVINGDYEVTPQGPGGTTGDGTKH